MEEGWRAPGGSGHRLFSGGPLEQDPLPAAGRLPLCGGLQLPRGGEGGLRRAARGGPGHPHCAR